MSGYDVVGVGALNVDLIYEADLREISRVLGRPIEPGSEGSCVGSFDSLIKYLRNDARLIARSGGGSAANTVYALARMGFDCSYIGMTGTDENSDFLLQELRDAGVDVTNIGRKIGGYCGTGISIIGDNSRTLLIYPNINDEFDKIALMNLPFLPAAKYFHLTSFVSSLGDGPLEAHGYIVNRAKKAGGKVSFDPGEFYCQKGLEALREVIDNTDILFVNGNEAGLLGGVNAISYVPLLVVKSGERGSTVYWDGRSKSIEPTDPRTFMIPEENKRYERGYLTLETTGAGDVFVAGFLASMLSSEDADPESAAKFASIVAAKSITRPGREAYSTREDLKYLH